MAETVVISERLKTCLGTAREVVAFTGAGMSAESGVPTFRGEDGLWKKFRPEELARFDAFIRNPDLVWEWYAYRKKLIAEVRPNAGHEALAALQDLIPVVTVVTQNVDNLHRRAGSRNVLELHGNIERNYCIGCGKPYENETAMALGEAPRCLSCGSLIRPDVVWFGEELPAEEWTEAMRACRRADLLLVIGTSAVVYPAASLPYAAIEAGAYVVEINLERTEFSGRADEFLSGKSGEILPLLLNEAKAQRIHESRN